MTLPASRIGDKGQRYVIGAKWGGIEKEIGYCDADPEKMVDAFLLHPEVENAFAVDRHDGDKCIFFKRKERDPCPMKPQPP